MKTLPNDFKVRMPWGYCGNEIWNRSRQGEVRVLTAERLAAMELLLGGTGHEAELERSWKNLLVGQHHDIQICGLLADARKFLSASMAASQDVLDSSLQFAASRMKGDGLSQVTVFNPLSWPRREWVESEIKLPPGSVKNLVARHEGRDVPTTLLATDRSSGGNIQSARVAFLAEVPPLSFASYSIHPAVEPAMPSASKVEVDPAKLVITTPFVEARLNPRGGIASLVDKRTGKTLLAAGKRSGFFAGKINGKDCESEGKWTLNAADEQGSCAIAREYGFVGPIPYTLEIRFRAESSQLDCRVSFHFEGEKIGQLTEERRGTQSPFIHEHKLRFKLFPAVGADAVGIRDLPFAIAETTNRYVEGIYWTALADSQQGLAFFNRGTMGSVREVDGGFSMPLAYAMDYIWGTRMLKGDYSYEFAVNPFTGEWRQADLHRQAIAYNFPVVSTSGKAESGAFGETVQPLELGDDHILLSALYPENGHVYARLYECAGQNSETAIKYQKSEPQLWQTDLSGHSEQPAANPLAFRPWQFRTFRVEPK
jgi:hypothetical protein